MALEDIFKALEHQADRDVSEVLAEARARAAAIVSEADIQARTIREKHAADAEAAAAVRTTRSLNSARLEARRKLAAVRQKAVSDVFAQAQRRVDALRDGQDGNEALFARLLEETVDGLDEEFALIVDERDVPLAEKILADRGMPGTVRAEITTAGGVVVSTGGDRVFRRNTLEDRFEKFAGIAQADVARILFS